MNRFLAIFIVFILVANLSNTFAIAKIDDCTFNIIIRVALTGNGATESFEQKMHDAVDEHWNKGFKVGDCDCDFKVDIITKIMENCSDEPFAHPSFHCIDVRNTKGVNRAFVTRTTWIKQLSDEHAETTAGDGVMEVHDTKTMIAHEFGHLMDLPDEYVDYYMYYIKNKTTGKVISGPHQIEVNDWYKNGNKKKKKAAEEGKELTFLQSRYGFKFSKPKPGSNNSIMATVGENATVLQRHVDSIFQRTTLKCPDNCCCGNGKIENDKNEQCDYEAEPTGCDSSHKCSDDCVCILNEVVTGPIYECGNGVLEEGEECDSMALPQGCPAGFECTAYCACEAIEETEPPKETAEIINPPDESFISHEEIVLVEYSDPARIEHIQYEIDGLILHQTPDPFEPWFIIPEMFKEGEHQLVVRVYDMEFDQYLDSINFTIGED